MSVAGPCEICGRNTVEDTCERCGRLVCDDHFEASLGYCTECAGDVAPGRGDREGVPDDEDMPDGVDTYRY